MGKLSQCLIRHHDMVSRLQLPRSSWVSVALSRVIYTHSLLRVHRPVSLPHKPSPCHMHVGSAIYWAR